LSKHVPSVRNPAGDLARAIGKEQPDAAEMGAVYILPYLTRYRINSRIYVLFLLRVIALTAIAEFFPNVLRQVVVIEATQ
jgi:hypothetical protein